MDRDETHLTVTGYDAPNAVVDTDTATQPDGFIFPHTLSVDVMANTIKYFTIATDDPALLGVTFSNIVSACN